MCGFEVYFASVLAFFVHVRHSSLSWQFLEQIV